MKRIGFILLCLACSAAAQAQSDSATPTVYWVQFANKYQSPYSVEHPEAFLSPLAIEKRQRAGIPVTEEDFPVNPEYVQRVKALDTSLRVLNTSRWMNSITVYSAKPGIQEAIQALGCVGVCERTATLKQPEPDTAAYRFSGFPERPTTHAAPMQYDYGEALAQVRLNNAHWLHRMGYNGEGMRIAVLDGGFKNADSIRHFQYLRESGRVKAVRNFAQTYANPFREGNHGTYVLSCIAAYLPGELVGTAPMADIYLAQTEDNRMEALVEEDNWIAGVEWADSIGCDVLTSSLSYSTFDDSTNNHTYAQTDGKSSRASRAARMAAERNLLLCNSAGNQGMGKWKFVGFPSDAIGIVTVGAVAPNGKSAPFSSKGPTADGRIKPDACAVGWETRVGAPWNKTIKSSGTSFSTPLMAGMLCCLRQAFPLATTDELIEALHESGSHYATPDSSYGYGIPDLLEAYNLLENKHNDTSLVSAVFPGHTATGTSYSFYLRVKKACSIDIHGTSNSSPDTITGIQEACGIFIKKCKPGTHRIDVKLPDLDSDKQWDVLIINIVSYSEPLKRHGKTATKKPTTACATHLLGIDKETPVLQRNTETPSYTKRHVLNLSHLGKLEIRR